jgi:hypothetical protein
LDQALPGREDKTGWRQKGMAGMFKEETLGVEKGKGLALERHVKAYLCRV